MAVILEIDEATTEALGWQPEEVVGLRSLEFIHPDDQGLAVDNWMQMLASTEPSRSVKMRHRHRDGSWVWLEVTNHNRLDDPSIGCVVADMVPTGQEPERAVEPFPQGVGAVDAVSKPLTLHEAIREREQLLHKLSEALPLGVLQVDALGRVIYTNRQLHTILAVGRRSTFDDQLDMVLPADRPLMLEAFETVLHDGIDNDIEISLDGSADETEKDLRRCTLSLRALTSESGDVTGAIACLADITESVRMREELRIRATFDHVTQCYNRSSTMEALERILAEADGSSGPAVIFIDLDKFKDINDRMGHDTGDELLGIVARRLSGAVREGSLVGRLGGDEFLVICTKISTAAQAMRAASRIAEALHHPMNLKSTSVSCRASIGVAWPGRDTVDADTLIGRADHAMYQAKRAGSDRPVLYVETNRQGATQTR